MRKMCLVFCLALLGAVGCTAPDRSMDTLAAEGFTDVELTGYVYWSCSEQYPLRTGFVATNPRGERVEGVVCCSRWTDCSVHF